MDYSKYKINSIKIFIKRLHFIFFLLFISGCSSHRATVQGYVEGNLIYLSSSQSGQLVALDNRRGDWVVKNQLLFQIEAQPYQADFDAAAAAVENAKSTLNNLLIGERPSELAQLQAQIIAAQAQLIYANKQLIRNKKLAITGSTAIQNLDLAQQNMVTAQQQLENLRQQLITAKLPARIDLIHAAAATLQQTQAELVAAAWTLNQTIVRAPADGQIFDNYYWVGEQVPAQQPIISLLIPSQIKIIFYLSEGEMSRININDQIKFISDNNHSQSGEARIDYISPTAEYTPPVLYTRDAAQKLVYRIEAVFNSDQQARQFHPGQILTIFIKLNK